MVTSTVNGGTMRRQELTDQRVRSRARRSLSRGPQLRSRPF